MNNKFKNTLAIALLTCSTITFGQIRVTNTTTQLAANSSAFIDGSSASANNSTTNVGKGLIYPRTDLSTFAAFSGTPTGIATSYPTRFDGMIVYNTATTGVAGVGATQGTLTAGFWYYDNKSATLTGGTWKPLSASASSAVDITTSETTTATKVSGAQVYGIKGSFTADGTTAAVTVAVPAGMTGFYKITIYKGSTTTIIGSAVRQFNLSGTNNVITGSGVFTEVYPAGSYDYVLEYFK